MSDPLISPDEPPGLPDGATPAPDWTERATGATVVWRGFLAAGSVPGFILAASCSGFGALARDSGFSLGNSLLMMATFYALPAQVVLTDQLARGGSLLAGALGVMLSGLRLLPMTVTLMPLLRSEGKGTRWRQVLAVHTIAVTGWIEGFRNLPPLPARIRLPFFLGLGCGLVGVSMLGTGLGYVMAGVLPRQLTAALLFLSPLYFMISLLATARIAADRLAILLGAGLGPPLYLLAPGFDLLATALIGGTAAHLLARRARS